MAAGSSSYRKGKGKGKLKGKVQLASAAETHTPPAAADNAATPQSPPPEVPPQAAAAGGADQLSAELYAAPPRVVVYDRSSVDELSQQFFGRILEDAEWGELVGAPAGALVEVSVRQDNVCIETMHPYLFVPQRRFVYQVDGDTLIYNDIFVARENAPAGFGTRVFARQVEEAARRGVKAILTWAVGPRDNWRGYTVWATLGYEADIPYMVGRKLREQAAAGDIPATWAEVRTVHELMLHGEAASRWWREHGDEFHGVFDVAAGSRSRYILNRYLARKEVRLPGVEVGPLLADTPPPASHIQYIDPDEARADRDSEDEAVRDEALAAAADWGSDQASHDDPDFNDNPEGLAANEFDNRFTSRFYGADNEDNARGDFVLRYAETYRERQQELVQDRWDEATYGLDDRAADAAKDAAGREADEDEPARAEDLAAAAWAQIEPEFAHFDVRRQIQAEQIFSHAYVDVYARRLGELTAEREEDDEYREGEDEDE